MMTIDGKLNGPYNTVKEKDQTFASAIYGSRMRRHDASLVYNCYYIAIIGVTLAETKMLFNQCEAIQSPVICATLRKNGHQQERGSKDCIWTQYPRQLRGTK
jgi:hypothetical protein